MRGRDGSQDWGPPGTLVRGGTTGQDWVMEPSSCRILERADWGRRAHLDALGPGNRLALSDSRPLKRRAPGHGPGTAGVTGTGLEWTARVGSGAVRWEERGGHRQFEAARVLTRPKSRRNRADRRPGGVSIVSQSMRCGVKQRHVCVV